MNCAKRAPGHPGIAGRWTSSAKTGIGTSLGHGSRVWFTVSHGILNEVYYPRLDQACIRDLGLIITDGRDFFSEEKRSTSSKLHTGAPSLRLENTCREGRYRVHKHLVSDPRRDVVLQKVSFQPLVGSIGDYRMYVLLAPHLGNRGAGNTAWLGDHEGVPMFFASGNGVSLALACSARWIERSVGFAGKSDGWLDLKTHRKVTATYDRADDGNVAVMGEIDLGDHGDFVLALGFGMGWSEAAHLALGSLRDGFERAKTTYEADWAEWHSRHAQRPNSETGGRQDLLATSETVLRTHESKESRGAVVASLSIPWGMAKGDDDLGGYHLVWPRDLVEAAGGLLAAGALDDARRVLDYLEAIQQPDGHWAQNNWLDGTPYWHGIQMDETALPILLVDLIARHGATGAAEPARFWPMMRRAAAFLAQNGPVSPQDRWEEDGGYSPFTVAAEIAALLVAADYAVANGEPLVASYLRETADAWNQNIERWMYATGTPLAHQVGVDGYYMRLAPPDEPHADSPLHGFVPIKNRPFGQNRAPAVAIVSPDALALVRFGLRGADDPRIESTLEVIDALLKVELPTGPAWRRYNGDGYGEHEDGSPFDGTGVGRPWPLLVGERAHYEIARGDDAEATRLLRTLESFANEGGMIPEQIWDAADVPARELFTGRASGSAMPLVWAHAEYIKLRRSLRERHVFDMPPQTVKRYLVDRTASPHGIWRFNHKCRSIERGKVLRIEVLARASVHWSVGAWEHPADIPTRDTGVGVHVVDLPTADLLPKADVRFTFHWLDSARWEGEDFNVTVSP
jgi:glucoamylase